MILTKLKSWWLSGTDILDQHTIHNIANGTQILSTSSSIIPHILMSVSFLAAKVSHKLNIQNCTYKWEQMHGSVRRNIYEDEFTLINVQIHMFWSWRWLEFWYWIWTLCKCCHCHCQVLWNESEDPQVQMTHAVSFLGNVMNANQHQITYLTDNHRVTHLTCSI